MYFAHAGHEHATETSSATVVLIGAIVAVAAIAAVIYFVRRSSTQKPKTKE